MTIQSFCESQQFTCSTSSPENLDEWYVAWYGEALIVLNNCYRPYSPNVDPGRVKVGIGRAQSMRPIQKSHFDESAVPKMRIWSILFIKSDLKWCIHLSRSLFLYFNYLVSVTAGWPESPRWRILPSSTFDFVWFVSFLKSITVSVFKIVWNCTFVGLLHHLFCLQHVLALWFISFQFFKLPCFA